MNLLDNSCANSLELNIKTGIFTNINNKWKNFHKTILGKDPTNVNIKVSNQSNIIHHSDKLFAFQDAPILTISKSHFLESRNVTSQ